MLLIQILLIIFFLFAIVGVFFRYHKGDISIRRALTWTFFWFLAGVSALYPGLPDYLAHMLGIGRGADLVSYFSLALLFYLVFYLYIRLNKIESQITKLVRKETLENTNLPSQKSLK